MRLYVALSPEAWDTLREVARRERRRPQDEAALLLGRILRRRAVTKREQESWPVHAAADCEVQRAL